jgi:NADPH-dependent ferric siderophore reductase
MEPISSSARSGRVRREIRVRDVSVARIETLGSGFLSITFKGDALADFASDSFDDHVKFIFFNADGQAVRRDYTPRQFAPGRRELTLEFALHGEGAAVNWARSATLGQAAQIAGPRGSMIIPMDYDWELLAGDATALPAIHRRLDELPPQARATVIVHVADAADQRAFASRARVDVRWVNRAEDLLAALRRVELPPGDGFVWFAGEASCTAEVRRVIVEEKGWPRQATKISAYWKSGASDFHAPREH